MHYHIEDPDLNAMKFLGKQLQSALMGNRDVLYFWSAPAPRSTSTMLHINGMVEGECETVVYRVELACLPLIHTREWSLATRSPQGRSLVAFYLDTQADGTQKYEEMHTLLYPGFSSHADGDRYNNLPENIVDKHAKGSFKLEGVNVVQGRWYAYNSHTKKRKWFSFSPASHTSYVKAALEARYYQETKQDLALLHYDKPEEAMAYAIKYRDDIPPMPAGVSRVTSASSDASTVCADSPTDASLAMPRVYESSRSASPALETVIEPEQRRKKKEKQENGDRPKAVALPPHLEAESEKHPRKKQKRATKKQENGTHLREDAPLEEAGPCLEDGRFVYPDKQGTPTLRLNTIERYWEVRLRGEDQPRRTFFKTAKTFDRSAQQIALLASSGSSYEPDLYTEEQKRDALALACIKPFKFYFP
jgi:hypothetical protein